MTHLSEKETTLAKAAAKFAPFDGWSVRCLRDAANDSGIDAEEARRMCPNGGQDLALLFHRFGDMRMIELLEASDVTNMRFRDKVAESVWLRSVAVEEYREAVRRWMAYFSLPINSLAGSRAVWGTSDLIWTYLGDSSTDLNWYTKRSILVTVLSSTALYWIGDSSEGSLRTRSFIDRRIDNVMSFEKVKSRFNNSKIMDPISKCFQVWTQSIRKPEDRRSEFPGWNHRKN